MLICFIEDHHGDLEATTKLIKQQFRDTEIYTAESVEEGEEVLRQARERGRHFDVIIIDLKIPRSKGEIDDFHEDFPRLVSSLFPDSTIIVRTAYVNSARLPQIMMRGANLVLNKIGSNAEKELIQAIAEYPILRRFRAIFGAEKPEADSRYRDRMYERGGSLTLELNSLIADILKNYDKLSNEAKEEINRHIPIRERDGAYVAEFTAGVPCDKVVKDEDA